MKARLNIFIMKSSFIHVQTKLIFIRKACAYHHFHIHEVHSNSEMVHSVMQAKLTF